MHALIFELCGERFGSSRVDERRTRFGWGAGDDGKDQELRGRKEARNVAVWTATPPPARVIPSHVTVEAPWTKPTVNMCTNAVSVVYSWRYGRVPCRPFFLAFEPAVLIRTMQANYGGTETAKALEAVYESLATLPVRPVFIFLFANSDARDAEMTNCHEEKKGMRTLDAGSNTGPGIATSREGIADSDSEATTRRNSTPIKYHHHFYILHHHRIMDVFKLHCSGRIQAETSTFVEFYPIAIHQFTSPLRDFPGPKCSKWIYGSVFEITNADNPALDEWPEEYEQTFTSRSLPNTGPQHRQQLRDAWTSGLIQDEASNPKRVDVMPWLSKMTLDDIGLAVNDIAEFNYEFSALDVNEKTNELSEALGAIIATNQSVDALPFLQAFIPAFRSL
ncbi:hypothetical protein BJ138DRAFT_1106063, partial [Hygrophoropsis aurantiaca]